MQRKKPKKLSTRKPLVTFSEKVEDYDGYSYSYSEDMMIKGKILNRRKLNSYDLDMYMIEGCEEE